MNILSTARRRAVLAALLEGCSIRATSRLTGVHKTTIMRLLVDAGEHCEVLLDQYLRNLPCSTIEADEIWTYVRKKQGHLTLAETCDPELGDQYTFIGLDPLSKLIVAHVVGRRNAETTTTFISQVRERIPGRLQIFTDGYPEYLPALDGIYGPGAVDYAQVIKPLPARAGEKKGSLKITTPLGTPDRDLIGTSFVERQNGTMRQQMRRFTRRTLAFSKKLRNLRAAVAAYVAFYNFCRPHGSLHRMTPAMALGIAPTFWSIDRLLP